ncbi:MAG: hypothetical protein JXA79_12860 [Deltaproteobacteria bacterium]|nr:hypothetical protein [Deltaproteobacteria bacterium]
MQSKPLKNWKELVDALNYLMEGHSYDPLGRSISDIKESYSLQMIYFGIIKPQYYDGYFDNIPFSPVTDELIQKARSFQYPIGLPGPMKYLSNEKYNPEYLTIPSGKSFTIQRKGQPSHDMLICSVASCLKGRTMNITNGSSSDLAFEAVQHYARIPIVNFFSSLPYLFDHLPERSEHLFIDKLLCTQMRCIDGLLFYLYEELNEGEVMTDALITSKVRAFFSSKTDNKNKSIKKADNITQQNSKTKKWWKFWE